MWLPIFLLNLTFLLHFQTASSIQISVGPTSRKCFTEQVPRGATIYVELRTSSARNPVDITLVVTNEHGHIVSQKSPITHNKVTIVPPTNDNPYYAQRNPLETYRFCLIPHPPRNQMRPEETRISYSIKIGGGGIGAQKVDLLKTSHIEQTNQKIRQLDDSINTLLFGMDSLRKQEDILSQQNAATSRHLVTVSILTSIVVVAVGILQFDAVKEVLRKRKIIP